MGRPAVVGLATLLVLSIHTTTVNGACKDLVDKENFIFAQGEKLTSCASLAKCYKKLCDVYGGENGICCKTCKSLGSPNCRDTITECFPVSASDGVKLVQITSCKQVLKKYKGFCSADVFGGKGKPCCKSCREVTCVNSEVWRYRGRPGDRQGRGLTCRLLHKESVRLTQRACRANRRGMGRKALKMREGCCRICTGLGYPPK